TAAATPSVARSVRVLSSAWYSKERSPGSSPPKTIGGWSSPRTLRARPATIVPHGTCATSPPIFSLRGVARITISSVQYITNSNASKSGMDDEGVDVDTPVASDTRYMREVNTAAVLTELRRSTGTSVTELARATGLSRQAVTRSISGLEQGGLVELLAPQRPGK